MSSISVLKGIYGKNGDTLTAYPKNLMVVPEATGLSNGYLKPVDGVEYLATTPGKCRGTVNWNGVLYAVYGSKLCSVTAAGAVTVIGDVGNENVPASLTYSFDRLAIVSDGDLYYLVGTSFAKVTDADVGTPLGGIWVDGFFMLHDGTYLIVSDLADPASFNPLKYASAESDPDPIKCLFKIKNEPYAVGRYSIEVFQNIGGNLFPFQRVNGGQIMKGTIGRATACVFLDNIAMLGGGKNEAPSIWLCTGTDTAKIATREIDRILAGYTEALLETAVVEQRGTNGHQLLYVHLPDMTLMYDMWGSSILNAPCWSVLYNGTSYPMRFPTWCYDKWICAHNSIGKIGYLTGDVLTAWGQEIPFEFNTIYGVAADLNAYTLNEVELAGTIGEFTYGTRPTITMQYSDDGEVWSRDFTISAPATAQRGRRIAWRRLGRVYQRRVLKFKWVSDFRFSPAILSVQVNALE